MIIKWIFLSFLDELYSALYSSNETKYRLSVENDHLLEKVESLEKKVENWRQLYKKIQKVHLKCCKPPKRVFLYR